jgi:hypothetical protein
MPVKCESLFKTEDVLLYQNTLFEGSQGERLLSAKSSDPLSDVGPKERSLKPSPGTWIQLSACVQINALDFLDEGSYLIQSAHQHHTPSLMK